MRHLGRNIILMAAHVSKGLAQGLIPKKAIKGVAFLALSLIFLLFFLAFSSFALFEFLLSLEISSWGASLITGFVFLIALLLTVLSAKRALKPKRIEGPSAGDLVNAFLDGLLNRD